MDLLVFNSYLIFVIMLDMDSSDISYATELTSGAIHGVSPYVNNDLIFCFSNL